jgi:membrane fusion protein, copper/silver efflux system
MMHTASAPQRVGLVTLRLLGAAILALVLSATGCESPAPSHAAVDTPVPVPQLVSQGDGGPRVLQLSGAQVPGMTVTEVRRIELPGVLEANGQVAFNDQLVSTIVSRVAGRIEATRVSQWDNVRRGEQIVALYSPDFMTAEAEYLQAQITAKLSSTPALAGSMNAAVNGASGGMNLNASMVLAARHKLELLGMDEADIDSIRAPNPTVWMRAPISGTVVENKAIRGAAVNPGDVLYSLGTLGDVWIVADIYESDLARVHLGQPLDAVTTAYPDDVFSGFISRISPGVDPNTHTVQIRCEVKNPRGLLKPDMLARVRITTNSGEALVIPMESLVFDTDAYYVYVDLGDGRYDRRKVEIESWREQGSARVISGLKAGERVVAAESIQMNALWHQANGESS